MPRLSVATKTTEDAEQLEARATIKKAWGAVPNLGEVLALSLPLTRAVLGFDGALEQGSFSGAVGEQIAIAVANENRGAYCLAAHSAAGKAYGASAPDIAAARSGRASDPKVQAALTFAQAVVRERGHVSDAQLAAVREAGYSDGEIAELVGHAISTTLTNYLHHISEVPIEYPAVEFDTTELATA